MTDLLATGGEGHARTRRRRMIASIIIFSVVAHLVALVLFGLWVVAQYFAEPEAVFEVQPELRIPPQTPEHKLNMARHQAMAPKPTLKKRLVATRPSDIAMPELPEVEADQALALDPSAMPSLNAASLAGAAAGFGGAEGITGGEGTGSGMSFFGIKDQARSVVIMIDVSASMFGRTGDLDYSTGKLMRKGEDQSFQKVRDEAIALIDGLGLDAKFGIIRWSGSARLWKESLVPATDENKRLAKEHIQNEVDHATAGPRGGRPGGTRHDYALEALFELNPEVAYMLSDGNATRSLGRGSMEDIPERELLDIIEKAEEERGKIPKIHTIYYVTGADKREEERMLRRIASKTGGESEKVKAEKR